MDDLIQAIATNDLVKVKKCFNEAMQTKMSQVVESRKIALAQSVMIEGEKEAMEDEDEDDSDDEDDDSDDEDEDEDDGK